MLEIWTGWDIVCNALNIVTKNRVTVKTYNCIIMCCKSVQHRPQQKTDQLSEFVVWCNSARFVSEGGGGGGGTYVYVYWVFRSSYRCIRVKIFLLKCHTGLCPHGLITHFLHLPRKPMHATAASNMIRVELTLIGNMQSKPSCKYVHTVYTSFFWPFS